VGPRGWFGHLGQQAGNHLIGYLLKDAMHLSLQVGKRSWILAELPNPLGLSRRQLPLHLRNDFRDTRNGRPCLRHANLHWLPRFLAGKVNPLQYDRLAETLGKRTTFWE
jgi:hypothetical protein